MITWKDYYATNQRWQNLLDEAVHYRLIKAFTLGKESRISKSTFKINSTRLSLIKEKSLPN